MQLNSQLEGDGCVVKRNAIGEGELDRLCEETGVVVLVRLRSVR